MTRSQSKPVRQAETTRLLKTEDVLLGRGSSVNRHEGNLIFRQLVLEARPLYQSAQRSCKRQVAETLVAKAKEFGGDFVDRKPEDCTPKSVLAINKTPVYIVSHDRAVEKAGQALREHRIYDCMTLQSPPPPKAAKKECRKKSPPEKTPKRSNQAVRKKKRKKNHQKDDDSNGEYTPSRPLQNVTPVSRPRRPLRKRILEDMRYTEEEDLDPEEDIEETPAAMPQALATSTRNNALVTPAGSWVEGFLPYHAIDESEYQSPPTWEFHPGPAWYYSYSFSPLSFPSSPLVLTPHNSPIARRVSDVSHHCRPSCDHQDVWERMTGDA